MPREEGREASEPARSRAGATFFFPPKIESRRDCRVSALRRPDSDELAVEGRYAVSSTRALKLGFVECDVAGARRMLLASELERPKNEARLRTL